MQLAKGGYVKKGLLSAVVLAAIIPTAVLAGTIANTPHDLSSTSTGPNKSSTADTCAFCHVAHNGSPGAFRPLWSHTMTGQNLSWAPATTVRGTTLPTSITSTQLQGSRGCMSCHDGTVALGDLLNGSGSTATGPNVTAGKLSAGKSLLNPANMQMNHPLGVPQPPVVAGFTTFKTVAPGSAVNYDANGNVQCDSCHNPHDNAFGKFLKVNPAGGAICLTCHNV